VILPKYKFIEQAFSENWNPADSHKYSKPDQQLVLTGDRIFESIRFDSRTNFKRNLINSLGIYELEEVFLLELVVHSTLSNLRNQKKAASKEEILKLNEDFDLCFDQVLCLI